MSFDTFGFDPALLRGISAQGFSRPTPIQQQAIPPALAGRDVLACAMTGSGKTAAFALPILQRLMGGSRGRTRALVLSPTRELAAQIEEHTRALARHSGLSTAAVFGGVGMQPQEKAFRRGVDVLVATPGRLLDHFRFPYARLAGLEVLVLDEADRMLDMGFLPDIRRILRHLPAVQQTLLFSATLPGPIATLAREMLKNPVSIQVERRSGPATGVTQSAWPVPSAVKSSLLVELVKRGQIRSAIAFTRTKHRANRLADHLVRNGVAADRIHGNRSQAQRTKTMAAFKAGEFPILVATDLASRGIDVTALSHVVSFDVPGTPEDYVHRVGRTARADALGDALLFVSPEEESGLRDIERAIGQRLSRMTLADFDYRKPAPALEIPLAQRLAEMRRTRGLARKNGSVARPGRAGRHARPSVAAGGGMRRRRASRSAA